MDKDKLISEVFLRPAIWDKRNENHHNNIVLKRLWSEIALECQSPDKILRVQWKKLRETFSKKLANATYKRSGDPEEVPKTQWPFFQSLMFLRDQFETRDTSGLFEDQGNSDDNMSGSMSLFKDETLNLNPETQTQGNVTNDTVSLSSKSTSISHSRKRKEPIGESLLLAELAETTYLQNKAEYRSNEDVDEDASFFHSLLPHVKELNGRKKLKFRRKVLELLEEITDEEPQRKK